MNLEKSDTLCSPVFRDLEVFRILCLFLLYIDVDLFPFPELDDYGALSNSVKFSCNVSLVIPFFLFLISLSGILDQLCNFLIFSPLPHIFLIFCSIL